jgi:hypothetical protein
VLYVCPITVSPSSSLPFTVFPTLTFHSPPYYPRLSGPHQNSPLFPIEPKMELLIGVLRFSVSESMTISEKLVESNGTCRVPDDDAKDSKSVSDNTHVEHLGGTVSCTGHSSRHSGNSGSTGSVTRKATITNPVQGKRSDPPTNYK